MATDPKEIAQQEIQKNFPLFGNIRAAVNYISVDTAIYDPSLGSVVEVLNSTQSNVYMIFTSFKLENVDGQMVHINDQKAICPTLDLTAVPSDLDYLVKDSVRWDIKNFKTDPANAAWILHVRKKVTV